MDKKQNSFFEQWLADIGTNRGLTKQPQRIGNAEPPAYLPSRSLQPHISHDPGLLASDLFQASTVTGAIFTFEDKTLVYVGKL